jgi:hypothetical protein
MLTCKDMFQTFVSVTQKRVFADEILHICFFYNWYLGVTQQQILIIVMYPDDNGHCSLVE